MSQKTSVSAALVWQHSSVTRQCRERLNKHKAVVIWFTGLSGSGKSTLANALEAHLYEQGKHTFVLDGDNIRHGLCADLGFSEQDRHENIRRVAEIAKLMLEAGTITLSAFISPFTRDRDMARRLVPAGDFIEIYCDCPLSVCEARDVKGLYKKARSGEIAQFTGISSPYEAPVQPELILDTHSLTIDACMLRIIELLTARDVLCCD